MEDSAPTSSAEALLDEFSKLPGRVARRRTFMEIAGCARQENACSNILAFFMDPEEAHGLGTLVLDALASAVDIGAADEGVDGNVSVDLEVGTGTGKRIDILITSEDQAILIENKIHATANNPFDDYAAYLDRIANGRNKRKILLTLYPTSEGSQWGFTNLTHEELVGRIRSLLGHYVSSADARHLTMFLDFLNTLENLKKETRMDKEFLKLLAERRDEIEDLHTDLEHFRNELETKARGLQSLVDASNPSVIGNGAGRRSTLSYNIHLVINVADEDLLFNVSIRAIISPHGWEIYFDVGRKNDYSRLRQTLQRLEIPFEEKERLIHPATARFIHPARFAYDENLEEIRPVLQELVDKLATGREHNE